jgi:hypothetical protein
LLGGDRTAQILSGLNRLDLSTSYLKGSSMRHVSRFFAVSTLLLAASTVAAHADTFSYDFSYPGGSLAFTYTSPTLLGLNTSFVPTTCTEYGVTCTDVIFKAVKAGKNTTLTVSLTAPNFVADIAGASTSFIDIGTNTYNLAGPATLVVTDIPDPISSVPELSSIALLGTGLLGLAGVARRKSLQP